MDFKSFNLNPRIAAGVEAAGFTEPTPIQAQSIPKIMQHCDVMGLAQTGTGKTAAFGLPILHQLMKGKLGHVRALIVAPTRELAERINEAITQPGKGSGLRSVTVYGGVGMNPQVTKLKRCLEIVVACPGRLLDHIKQGTIDLSKVDVLVLDEADRMFDMGYQDYIMSIIEMTPRQRQTLLFSATYPDEIKEVSHAIQIDPVDIRVESLHDNKQIEQIFYEIQKGERTKTLVALLQH